MALIRQAVILAAGKGSRIREEEGDLPKPLQRVAGLSLIKRTILTMARAGVTQVYVVTGFLGDRVRAALGGDPDYARAGVALEFIDNPDYEKSNGVSVLKVVGRVQGPFLLSMADHVYEVSLVKQAMASDIGRADLHLCVDRRIGEVYDIDDATKVRTEGPRIADIGKQIATYDCIDCGVFAVTPALLETLEKVYAERGDCSLSDGVRRLAESGRAHVVDIGNAFWQDVDTPGALARAERELFRLLRKRVDGPVSRYINRPISLAITRLLVNTGVTPNQMTVVANAIGACGIWLAFGGTYGSLLAGALLIQAQSILDGCDGELARLKFQSSRFGEWLDNVLDDCVNLGFGVALGWSTAVLAAHPIWKWLALAGAGGYLFHHLVVYRQLAVVHRTGNPFAFRWWFQGETEDLTARLARPGLAARLAAGARALARRDLFLFGFLVLVAARVPEVAVIWYALIGVGHFAVTVAHVLLQPRRRGSPT